MQLLYQDNPKVISTYTRHKNRSFTDSLGSYQNGASKEILILRWNRRIPTIEVVLHFFNGYTAKEIIEYRKKIFRYLREHGLESAVSIELTRGADGQPNNTVHFHFLLDDPRKEKEIRELFHTACRSSGLNDKDFRIDYRELTNGYTYFNYFTKCGYSERVILFQKGTGIQKFYQVGKWYQKSKIQIWEDVKTYYREKNNANIEESNNSDELVSFNEADKEYLSDEVPLELGAFTDLDREVLRKEYGIDSDKISVENQSNDGFYIPGIGRFHKFSSGIWTCIVDELSGEQEQDVEDTNCGKIPFWNDYRSCNYHFPKEYTCNRRYEWRRYQYSIAFLQ